MKHALFVVMIFLGILCKGQNTVLLDSISLDPVLDVRVSHNGEVYYSNKFGQVNIESFNTISAFAIHPEYVSKEFIYSDTILLKPVDYIFPELEIVARNKSKIIFNERNKNWRLTAISIDNGSIHGIGLERNTELIIEGTKLYFNKSLKEDLCIRVLIFDTKDTLSSKPTPVFGISTFDTVPKGSKEYTLDISSYSWKMPIDGNYVVSVEFKFDESLWAEDYPELELWETTSLNYFYFLRNYTLVQRKSYNTIGTRRVFLTTAGIEVIATMVK